MKILFISLLDKEAYNLRTLEAMAESRHHWTRTLFLKSKVEPVSYKDCKQFFKFIGKFEPEAIVLIIEDKNKQLYLDYYERLGSITKCKIILGGPAVSLNPKEWLSYCDYLCVGENEESFVALIDELDKGNFIPETPNIWFKVEDNLIENQTIPVTQTIGRYTAPRLENRYCFFVDKNKCKRGDPLTLGTEYNIYLSRPSLDAPLEWKRIKTFILIMRELSRAKAKIPNLKTIHIKDEIFNPPTFKWTLEFCDLYRTKIGLQFTCNMNINYIESKTIVLLRSVGLTEVYITLDTTEDWDKILRLTSILSKSGVNAVYTVVMNGIDEGLINLLKAIKTPKDFVFVDKEGKKLNEEMRQYFLERIFECPKIKRW